MEQCTGILLCVYLYMGSWINKEELDLYEKINYEMWKAIMWGSPSRQPKEDDNVKWAWVYIGEERKMIGVDNKTMKGYKTNNEAYPSWLLPLQEQEYDRFERWCTTFDM